MARYIIAERWQTILSPATLIAAGTSNSPTAAYTTDQLDASGECKFNALANTIPNALQEPDSILVKRVRLWSPMQSLGLAGGTTTNTHGLQIVATRRAPAPAQSGQAINIAGPLNLGEWVDVNQTLSVAGLVAPFTGWTLGAQLPNPISLDSSRMAASLVGVALLNFTVQVEIAHTLQGLTQ